MTRKPINPAAPPMEISPQQKTALWLYASEMDIQQVADLMGVSRPTAKEHLHRAYKNLGTSSARHALRVAYELGIFVPQYIRDDLGELGELRVQRETVLAAADSLQGKVVAPESAITPIQVVAAQLATMAHVTDGDGLARELRNMSNNLDRALKELGASTVESPLDGATRALEHVGMYGVNRVFLGVVLEDHPEVKHLADQWDWSDTEVRDKIAQHVICDMLGLSRNQYEQAIHNDQSETQLMKRFWDAHEKWT
jgi:DNA-binding CsgD family transcriptional regulator